MTQPIIWIDMTDLYLWRGHHTGIQRVVYNIAVHYAKLSNTKFFVYEEKDRTFYEIDFSIIAPPAERPEPPSWRRVMREEVTSQIRNYYTRLPENYRRAISPRVKPVLGHLYHGTHHTIHEVKATARRFRHPEEHKKAVFAPGDEIIILGAGWVRPNILVDLWRLKQQIGFQVFHFVHDVIPVFAPHLFGPGHFELITEYLFDMAQVTDGIITNSESSKRDTAKFFKDLLLPELPIGIIRLGDEIGLKGEPHQPDAPIEAGEYVLAVGTIEIRKNYALLYAAYKLAIARGIELPKLVIVGRAGWNAGDTVFAMQHDPEVDGRIIILQNVHDSELDWLYRNCKFSIYPSTYEGWGLPIAEALVHGKVCLAANTSSMPEIAGDLIGYFQPFDSSDCLQVIAKYLDPKHLAAKEEAIRRSYKVTTWEETYRDFVAEVERQKALLAKVS